MNKIKINIMFNEKGKELQDIVCNSLKEFIKENYIIEKCQYK